MTRRAAVSRALRKASSNSISPPSNRMCTTSPTRYTPRTPSSHAINTANATLNSISPPDSDRTFRSHVQPRSSGGGRGLSQRDDGRGGGSYGRRPVLRLVQRSACRCMKRRQDWATRYAGNPLDEPAIRILLVSRRPRGWRPDHPATCSGSRCTLEVFYLRTSICPDGVASGIALWAHGPVLSILDSGPPF